MELHRSHRPQQAGIRPTAEFGGDIRKITASELVATQGRRPFIYGDKTDLCPESDEASAATDLLFSLHQAIIAHIAALAALRGASAAALGAR